jgi:hypothetical protein
VKSGYCLLQVQGLKGSSNWTVPDIVIGIHTQNNMVTISNPGFEGLAQILQETLLGVLMNLLFLPEVDTVLAPDRTYTLSMHRAIGRDEPDMLSPSTYDSHPGPPSKASRIHPMSRFHRDQSLCKSDACTSPLPRLRTSTLGPIEAENRESRSRESGQHPVMPAVTWLQLAQVEAMLSKEQNIKIPMQ